VKRIGRRFSTLVKNPAALLSGVACALGNVAGCYQFTLLVTATAVYGAEIPKAVQRITQIVGVLASLSNPFGGGGGVTSTVSNFAVRRAIEELPRFSIEQFLANLLNLAAVAVNSARGVGGGGQSGSGPTQGPMFRRINAMPGGPGGPTITFVNDTPGGASTDLPVRGDLAEAIERAVVICSCNVNINSTTGGHTSGAHLLGLAVDINRIEGISAIGQHPTTSYLQGIFLQNTPNFSAVHGPLLSLRQYANGQIVNTPQYTPGHWNHLHLSVQP
jgi:hypothetical protein